MRDPFAWQRQVRTMLANAANVHHGALGLVVGAAPGSGRTTLARQLRAQESRPGGVIVVAPWSGMVHGAQYAEYVTRWWDAAQRGRPDLVIVDTNDGVDEVVRELLPLLRTETLVVLTAHDRADAAHDALASGWNAPRRGDPAVGPLVHVSVIDGLELCERSDVFDFHRFGHPLSCPDCHRDIWSDDMAHVCSGPTEVA